MAKLFNQHRGDGAKVRGCLPEAVLVVLKALGEGTEDARPQGTGNFVAGEGRRQGLDGRVDDVGGVRGDDGLEVLEEVGQETVCADLALGLAGGVGLGKAGARRPVDQVREHGAEGGVVELVDHLERGLVDEEFDLLELGSGGEDTGAAEVEGGEEDAGEEGGILGDGGLGVLVQRGAEDVEVLLEGL